MRLARRTFPDYGVWHVTTRGVERRQVYLDRGDARHFLAHLARAVDAFDLELYALCLMPNHYHLILECLRDSLSKAMHRVNGRYAEWFNGKYRRSGHLWGDRFALWQVRDEEHLREACAYVLNNPVRAGLCETAVDWPWSGSRYASALSSEVAGPPPDAFSDRASSIVPDPLVRALCQLTPPLAAREPGANAHGRARADERREGAALVGDPRRLVERLGGDPLRPHVDVHVGRDDSVTGALDLVHRHDTARRERVHRPARPRDLSGERGHVAGRVRGREQLLGARLVDLARRPDARRDVDRERERARSGRRHTGSARERAPPVDGGLADDPRH